MGTPLLFELRTNMQASSMHTSKKGFELNGFPILSSSILTKVSFSILLII